MKHLVATAFVVLLGASCHRAPVLTGAAGDGQKLYAKYCATCHGAHEEGYGADNSPSLVSRTFRETVSAEFLRSAIEKGRPGTAMAGYARRYGGPLEPLQVEQLLAFLQAGAPPTLLAQPPPPGDTMHGGVLFAVRCAGCHGTETQRATAVHLANPAFLASASDAFLRAAIERGRPGTRMPSWGDKLPPQDIIDLVSYLRSLAHPAPPPIAVAPGAKPSLLPQPAQPAPATTKPGTAPAPTPSFPAAPDVEGAIVVNPRGKHASFTLKDDLYVPSDQLAEAYKEKRRLVVIDARSPADYLRLHVEGAISIPYYDMHELSKVPNDGTFVVAYCACPHHVSGIVVDELRKRGYKHTAVLDEGVFFWQQHGYPVVAQPGQVPVAAPPPMPNMRGIQIRPGAQHF